MHYPIKYHDSEMVRERSEHTNEVSVMYDVLFIIFIFYI